MTSRSGFTLVELLVVLAIIAIAMSITLTMPAREQASVQVRLAAEELAATFRATRNRAVEEKAYFAVAFNIQNEPGSSGRILNNRSGGHWYRVLGPAMQDNSYQGYAAVPLFRRNEDNLGYHDSVIKNHLDAFARAWVSEPHLLPKGKVRFLALTDQDCGNQHNYGWKYAPTYPRPWFGTWDKTTGKLYPWGGYTPEIADEPQNWGWGARTGFFDTTVTSCSGFYYEGVDGRITGCRNPRDRIVAADANGSGYIEVGSTEWPANNGNQGYTLLKQDAPRPLINADWLDYMIVFQPNGWVFADWFRLRRGFARYVDWDIPQSWKHKGLHLLGPGDMCNLNYAAWWSDDPNRQEIANYDGVTGSYHITLARDAVDDTDTFAGPLAALKALRPVWRVGVSRFGAVSLFEVSGQQPATAVFNDTAKGAWWQGPITNSGEPFCGRTLAFGGVNRIPVSDFLVPAMLENRQWWLEP
jgi:prepilin-type N-terminal cleavage/methylation domain-containing protein